MEIEVRGLGLPGRPASVRTPAVGARRERARLPGWLLPLAVEIVAEERRLDRLAELARGLMAAERDQPDAVRLRRAPLSVEPRAGDHEIRTVGVVLRGVPEDLPRPPRIFLIKETSDVQVRDRRCVELADPRFLLPELVIVRVRADVVPVGDRAVQGASLDVRERAERQIPRVRVVDLEREVRVLVLVRLLEHRVLERVALAQR